MDGLLAYIANQGGLLGSLLVVALLAIGILYRDNRSLQKDLRDALLASTAATNKYTEVISAMSENIKTLVTLTLNGRGGKAS